MRRWPLTICALVAMAPACGGTTQATVPPAELYGRPVTFAGEWIGEVGGRMGALTVRRLDRARYYGVYTADDGGVKYVLSMEQSMLGAEDGGAAPANRVLFTWQDGRGGRGDGWLLINREDSALTGESSYGDDAGTAALAWQFIRVE